MYNSELYIGRCVESVLNQDYKEYEIIIVDDGSTDNSLSICEKYKKNNDKIRLFHKENEGQIKSRLFGINESRMDYVMFLDSDDCYKKETLNICNEYLNKYDADVLVFGLEKVGNDGSVIDVWGEKDDELFITQKKTMIEKILSNMSYNSMCRKVVKRNVLKSDDCSLVIRYGEDLLQTLSILDNCRSMLFVSDILYEYYDNPLSVMSVKNYDRWITDASDLSVVVNDYIIGTNLFSEREIIEINAPFTILYLNILREIARTSKPYKEIKKLFQKSKKTDYYKIMIKNDLKGTRNTIEYFCIRMGLFHVFYFAERLFGEIKSRKK